MPHPAKKKTIKGKKQDISIQTYSCQNCLKPILESSSLFKDNQKSKECIHCYVKRMQDERQKASHLAVRLDVVFQCQDAINSAKIKNLESKQKEQEKINKHLILKVNKIDKKTSVNQTLTNRLISKIYNPTEKDIEKLDSKIKARRLAKDRDDIEEASEKTIYQPFWIRDSNGNIIKYNYYSIIGWTSFFILFPISIYCWYKLKNKKRKIKNSYDELRDKFESWRFSIFSTLGFFIISFILIQQALIKFRIKIGEWAEAHQYIVFTIVACLLGLLAIADGFISSNLKTNLQRLSFNIQESVHDKELKKSLFFVSQEATETLKETFKKFGMLAIPALVTAILVKFKDSKFTYIYYAIPVAYAIIRIVEVNRLIKRLEKQI